MSKGICYDNAEQIKQDMNNIVSLMFLLSNNEDVKGPLTKKNIQEYGRKLRLAFDNCNHLLDNNARGLIYQVLVPYEHVEKTTKRLQGDPHSTGRIVWYTGYTAATSDSIVRMRKKGPALETIEKSMGFVGIVDDYWLEGTREYRTVVTNSIKGYMKDKYDMLGRIFN